MTNWLSLLPLLATAGAVGGVLAGLFGIGGGLVIVPALYFTLQYLGVVPEAAMAMAVQTSLVSIVATSISSMRAHHQLGNINWSMVKVWLPATVLGVISGGVLVAQIRSRWFAIGFAVLLLFIAGYKLLRSKPRAAARAMPSNTIQRLCAAGVGLISTCVGVGGGATSVPAMLAMGVPVHTAIGSSAALGLAIALPGSVTVFLLSEPIMGAPEGSVRLIYFPALLILSPLTVIFAPCGARLGKRLSVTVMSRLFALLLCLISIKMLLSSTAV